MTATSMTDALSRLSRSLLADTTHLLRRRLLLVSRLPMAVVRLLLLQPTGCEWLHVLLLRIISRLLLLMINIIMRRRAETIAIRLRLRLRWRWYFCVCPPVGHTPFPRVFHWCIPLSVSILCFPSVLRRPFFTVTTGLLSLCMKFAATLFEKWCDLPP